MIYRQSAGKRILLLACIIMIVCLIQRAFFPHELPISAQADAFTLKASEQSASGTEGKGITLCLLSFLSIQCAQPLFFDGMIPALFVFLALVYGVRFRNECSLTPRCDISTQRSDFAKTWCLDEYLAHHSWHSVIRFKHLACLFAGGLFHQGVDTGIDTFHAAYCNFFYLEISGPEK